MNINFTKLRYLNNKILYYGAIILGIFCFKYEPVLNFVFVSSKKITIWSTLIAICLFINTCLRSLDFILNVSLAQKQILFAFLQSFAVFLFMNLVCSFYIQINIKKNKLRKLLNNLLVLYQKTKLIDAKNLSEPKALIFCMTARLLYDFLRILVYYTIILFSWTVVLDANHWLNSLKAIVFILIPIWSFSFINSIFYAITIHLVIVHERLNNEVIKILKLSSLSKKPQPFNIENSLSNRLKKVSLLYQDLIYNFYNLKKLLEPSLFVSINTLRLSFIADVAVAASYIYISQPNITAMGTVIACFYLIVTYIVYLLCFLHGPQLLNEKVSYHYEISGKTFEYNLFNFTASTIKKISCRN